ncbi:SDR family NAD(P)-dependent oxidoreductase [Amycolatopsis acidiphila]|uniref:SDR family NAD(P)-dependent oxidoreductase n=1 Tax=Amycolatopsis acidiphila TaxID=715473 RepID=UPI003570B206
MTRSRGAIVNILSANALAPMPFVIPAYSLSKAAAFSMTQSLRALVAGQGVRVHAVLPGPVATDMTQGSNVPMASPESVAQAIFDAVGNGEKEIFPDPASAPIGARWRDSVGKLLERQLAGGGTRQFVSEGASCSPSSSTGMVRTAAVWRAYSAKPG